MDKSHYNLDTLKINLNDLYPLVDNNRKYLGICLDIAKSYFKEESFLVKNFRSKREYPIMSRDYGDNIPLMDYMSEIYKYLPRKDKVVFSLDYSLKEILNILFDMKDEEYLAVFGDNNSNSQNLLRRVGNYFPEINKLKVSCNGMNFYINQLLSSINGNLITGFDGNEFKFLDNMSSSSKIVSGIYIYLLTFANKVIEDILRELNTRLGNRSCLVKSQDCLTLVVINNQNLDIFQPIYLNYFSKQIKINFNTSPVSDNVDTFQYMEVMQN